MKAWRTLCFLPVKEKDACEKLFKARKRMLTVRGLYVLGPPTRHPRPLGEESAKAWCSPGSGGRPRLT